MATRPMGLMFGGVFDEEEEEDDEHPTPENWTATDESCIACSERIHFTEEVVHLTVEQAFHNGKEVVRMPFIFDEGEYEGDFYYDPIFLDFACWENLAESVREMVENSPPVKNREEILGCDFCGCSICEWEIFGAAYVGEFHVSRRVPNGRSTPTFSTNAEPYIICLGCLILISEHEVDLWDQDLNQNGECQECTHIRCWRNESCSCPCHDEGSEPDEDG